MILYKGYRLVHDKEAGIWLAYWAEDCVFEGATKESLMRKIDAETIGFK